MSDLNLTDRLTRIGRLVNISRHGVTSRCPGAVVIPPISCRASAVSGDRELDLWRRREICQRERGAVWRFCVARNRARFVGSKFHYSSCPLPCSHSRPADVTKVGYGRNRRLPNGIVGHFLGGQPSFLTLRPLGPLEKIGNMGPFSDLQPLRDPLQAVGWRALQRFNHSAQRQFCCPTSEVGYWDQIGLRFDSIPLCLDPMPSSRKIML